MSDFLIGAATAAHQVEGNNIHSDFWVMENLKHSDFAEPSGLAVDHYNRYEEDIKLLADAGCSAYRFSIEWARIEPEEGRYDYREIGHYRKVLHCCRENGITPIVTLHHSFGLIAVDRKIQTRYPKESLKVLGSLNAKEGENKDEYNQL